MKKGAIIGVAICVIILTLGLILSGNFKSGDWLTIAMGSIIFGGIGGGIIGAIARAIAGRVSEAKEKRAIEKEMQLQIQKEAEEERKLQELKQRASDGDPEAIKEIAERIKELAEKEQKEKERREREAEERHKREEAARRKREEEERLLSDYRVSFRIDSNPPYYGERIVRAKNEQDAIENVFLPPLAEIISISKK